MTARRQRMRARSFNEPLFPEPFDCPCCREGIVGSPLEIRDHVAANIPELAWRWERTVDDWMLVGEPHVVVAAGRWRSRLGACGVTVAFHRSYPVRSDGRSKRITRLHILREEPPAPRARESIGLRWPQGECGTSAGPHRESLPVYLDPMPATPPAGLTWCPACIGKLAERCGAIARIAAELAGGAR